MTLLAALLRLSGHLKVTGVESDALVSGEQRVAMKDIARLERRSINWTLTTLLAVGLLGVAVLAVALTTKPVGFGSR
jgi:hypothetical protein